MSKSLEFPFLATIPKKVLCDKSLFPNAKILFGCLVGLAINEGYAYPTDEQLAQMFEVNERQIKRWLNDLEEKGYIHRETQNKPHKNEKGVFYWKRERKIYVNGAFSKNVCESDKKVPIGSDFKVPIIEGDKKVPVNSKSISKKGKDIYISKKSTEIPKKKEEPQRKFYGQFVKLTDQEYQSLTSELGIETLTELIPEVNDYCASHGKKYKNYASAIRTFARRKKNAQFYKSCANQQAARPGHTQKDSSGNPILSKWELGEGDVI